MISLVLSLSFALDAFMGEPPTKVHPVVLMGNYITWMKKQNKSKAWAAFWQGLILLLLGLGMVSFVVLLILYALRFFPDWLTVIWLAIFLKPMFSVRSLLDAGESVKLALEQQDLEEARRLLSWHLVSRDTSELSEAEVAGAAISSLAENLTDSIIAPLFYFMLFGLTGAALYRFINTADAMLGYRTQELEYFGKSAARLDDLLNFVPARLTSVLLFFVLLCLRKNALKGLRSARAARTPSSNGAWTMAMVAGGLDICLEKKDVYSLNETGKAATAKHIHSVQQLILAVSIGFTLVSLAWPYVH